MSDLTEYLRKLLGLALLSLPLACWDDPSCFPIEKVIQQICEPGKQNVLTVQNIDELRKLRELWNLFCLLSAEKKIDLPTVVHLWAKAKRDSLSRWASENSFDDLCNAGCSPFSLAITLWALEACQRWQRVWRTTIGSTRDRNQIVRSFEKAAAALEELQNSFYSDVLEDVKRSVTGDLRKSDHDLDLSKLDIHSVNLNIEPTWPSYAPVPAPATTIRALRLYARVLGFLDIISEETQAHSAESFSRYLISAYVKRATGAFHDAQVSALIGTALGGEVYDETAHRMWRSRNYDELEAAFSLLADLLIGIGMVTSPST